MPHVLPMAPDQRASLNYVFPCFPIYDVVNRGLSQREHFCDLPALNSNRMKPAHLPDIGFGYLGSPVRLSARNYFWMHPKWMFISRYFSCPSLGILVMVVVRARSNKKMIWINTRRIVAFMKDAHSLRNCSKMNHPACPVRAGWPSQKSNTAISKSPISSSNPRPAIIMPTLVHLLPEVLLVFIRKMRDDFLSLIRIHSAILVRVLSRVQRLMHSNILTHINHAYN